MSAAAEKTVRDDQSGQALAEATGVEYLKASAVSVDPRALSLLEREDCKRLRAIPLAAGSGGALVAVSAPSEERFAAIRELTGEQTRFVLISDGTLDALLSSRMFADAPAASAAAPAATAPATQTKTEPETAPAAPAEDAEADPPAGPAAAARRRQRGDDEEAPLVEEVAASEVAAPADTPPSEPTAHGDARASDATVDNIVSAVLNALKHRVGSGSDSEPADTQQGRSAAPAPPVAPVSSAAPESPAVPGSTAELLKHLDATIASWSAVRAALANVHTEFEDTKRALRETKEQLSVAHADNDQYRKRVRTLEGEVVESRELVAQARTRLQEAADLLEADPSQLREAADLL